MPRDHPSPSLVLANLALGRWIAASWHLWAQGQEEIAGTVDTVKSALKCLIRVDSE